MSSIAHTLGFKIEQHRRAIVQLQIMIADFDRQADSLDREVRIEEDRANNHDPSHFAYPTYAKAAIQRRDNLRHSSNELKTQFDTVKKALAEAELEAA
jgi:flagellar FliJ protein